MKSQEQQILEHLQKGKSLTAMEALAKFGVFRLAARVRDLRASGHPVRTIMETDKRTGKRWARYWMGAK